MAQAPSGEPETMKEGEAGIQKHGKQSERNLALPRYNSAMWLDSYAVHPILPIQHECATSDVLCNGPHRWALLYNLTGQGITWQLGPSVLSILSRLLEPLVDKNYPAALAVPEDWEMSSCEVFQALRVYWEHIQKTLGPKYPVVTYTPRSHFSSIPYPQANVTLHEIRDEEGKISPRSVEYTMLKILQTPDMRTRTSSPTPDLTFESFLPGIAAQIPGCTAMIDATIPFPSYSVDYGTSSRPRVACCPSSANLPNNLPDGFSPIIFAANPVKELVMISGLTGESYGYLPDPTRHPLPDRRNGILELAKLFQPTLQLFVMDLTARFQIEEGKWRPEWNPLRPGIREIEMPRVPEKYFVYGMNYDDASYSVYGFFPRYTVSNSGRVEWSFCCYEVTGESGSPFASMQGPMDLVNILLVIQRHVLELAQVVRGLSLPPLS
ncbi:hypothetical protein OF83DRAFT_1127187 [Amylostereum chailletii]|nr:hypothetical protein OF83DRAFT_1127187 [Amylostereum chailletii]